MRANRAVRIARAIRSRCARGSRRDALGQRRGGLASQVRKEVVHRHTAHEDYAASITAKLRDEGFRVDLVPADEQLGKRIRSAKLERLPYVLV
ncbi:MAG: His/Gly/Thr/Pro-type tRNA ligase C-terminal domain-containing protein, partial [Actinomycetota bacterium]